MALRRDGFWQSTLAPAQVKWMRSRPLGTGTGDRRGQLVQGQGAAVLALQRPSKLTIATCRRDERGETQPSRAKGAGRTANAVIKDGGGSPPGRLRECFDVPWPGLMGQGGICLMDRQPCDKPQRLAEGDRASHSCGSRPPNPCRRAVEARAVPSR
ncbi:uncharacterized protein B0I36DRAFT_317428 [Microdochium trichocladiopsis]|uniref:Uncharacterized protein n=1 Tax=Microdochium trichocladiopsis TaxID=1682393 RepID=A0A9P8Y8N7_9PEZI|nr:uncharacterized protein B0I36DRAFT_317428 [Microdochium trichocladiopsis]KAH7035014.1 hypothetical protein B0I36DRAFT_317428 [Microdochium trichocladiopsis]